jgi:hypothetical protein
MKKYLIILLFLPPFCSAQTYEAVTHGGKSVSYGNKIVVNLKTNIYCITGTVLYGNVAQTAYRNVTISLKQGGVVVQTTVTDNSGAFTFTDLDNGTYTVDPGISYPWGGVNGTDGLCVTSYVTGPNVCGLSGCKLLAADVDGNGIVNSNDALLIAQRYAMLIYSFPAGDWCYCNNTATISGANVNLSITTLCFGDVNGSYVPSW